MRATPRLRSKSAPAASSTSKSAASADSAKRKVHDVAQRFNVPVWCGGMLESGIGRAHNIALSTLEISAAGRRVGVEALLERRHHRARSDGVAARHDRGVRSTGTGIWIAKRSDCETDCAGKNTNPADGAKTKSTSHPALPPQAGEVYLDWAFMPPPFTATASLPFSSSSNACAVVMLAGPGGSQSRSRLTRW